MNEIQLCKLCKSKPSSRIYSHIFTHFIIKSMLNPIGNTQRGMGRSFQFGGSHGSDIFLERDISMDDVERLLGDHELTEEDISEIYKDPYSKSYLLCNGCEDRIGIVENYFRENVFGKITPEDQEFVNAALNSNNLLIKLFFLSMIWRASVAEFDNFTLSTEIEERLRVTIHDSIGCDLDETMDLVHDNSKIILNEAIFCCMARSCNEPTTNLVTINDRNAPYHFEINEYALCYFPDQKNLSVQQDLFGLEKYVSDRTINYNEDRFKVCIVECSDWALKNSKLYDFFAKKFIRDVINCYTNRYRSTHGNSPDPELIDAFTCELIKGPVATLALRYSRNRIDRLIEKYIHPNGQ